MKKLLADLRENALRSSDICQRVATEYLEVRERVLFFELLINGIQISHHIYLSIFPEYFSRKIFFVRHGKNVLLTDLEPPEILEPEIERVFLGDIDEEKMSDGNLGYRIRIYPTLSNEKQEVQEYLISFNARKWELVDKNQ
jgi:hypothetical protein